MNRFTEPSCSKLGRMAKACTIASAASSKHPTSNTEFPRPTCTSTCSGSIPSSDPADSRASSWQHWSRGASATCSGFSVSCCCSSPTHIRYSSTSSDRCSLFQTLKRSISGTVSSGAVSTALRKRFLASLNRSSLARAHPRFARVPGKPGVCFSAKSLAAKLSSYRPASPGAALRL